jgi:hypothetical protein
MEILKFLSAKEIEKIKKVNVGLTFGNEESDIFFKWVYLTYKLNLVNVLGKKLTINNGLFYFNNQKNGLKPIKYISHHEIFSLTKITPKFEFLTGKRILEGYDKDKSQVKSCMTFTNNNSKQTKGLKCKLDFYVKNKNINLFVIRENDKIVARTLIWKSGKTLYHDRIYSFNPLWRYFMEMFFKIKGIEDIDNYNSDVKVKLNYLPTFKVVKEKTYYLLDIGGIPHLDNMEYIDPKNKILSNEYYSHNLIDLNDVGCDNERLDELIEEYSLNS